MKYDEQLQQDIKKFISEYYYENSISPSLRKIAGEFGIGKTTVSRYIERLKHNGELFDSSVGVVTGNVEKYLSASQPIGLVGSISCGPLMFAEQNITGYFRLPTALVGEGEFFLLKASGNSMVNAGIDDGDLVLIRKQSVANNGDIVVALYEDETTLKRFYKDEKKQQFVLHPENDELKDIIVEGDLYIQGVAIKVLKDLKKMNEFRKRL